MMKLGLEVLINSPKYLKLLKAKRCALVAIPASVNSKLEHSIDVLSQKKGIKLTAAFGPQHGLRGDKQDNMIETPDEVDAKLGIPVFSLYGKVRRLTPQMLDHFDVLLFDLQDIGTRIYTFATTLKYLIEDCAQAGKEIWVLDRPNPIGRPIEGHRLIHGNESFVGASTIPMRHGLTLGELAKYYQKTFSPGAKLTVIPMQGYKIASTPGHGWPMLERPWVNPSPNAASLNMARCFPGTVMLEGTTLSEGRGTTRPLECVGAPDINFSAVLKKMNALKSEWLKGCAIRPFYFEPTFHKHVGKLCSGLFIHAELSHYSHSKFKPYRLMALVFKAIRELYPDYPLWRDFPYEYETTRLAIDVICGGTHLREWVDDTQSKPSDLESMLKKDEQSWIKESKRFWLY